MGISWFHGLIIPLIKTCFVGGIFAFIIFYIYRAFNNAYSKQMKFFWKFKIRKKPYPESSVKWIMECMDKGIGWYDAKRLLYVKGQNENDINEMMFIYDEILKTMGNKRGKEVAIRKDLPQIQDKTIREDKK